MQMKTSELSGPVLAYMAAIAEGWTCYWTDSAEQGDWLHPSGTPHGQRVHRASFRPDLDWSQGGTVIDRMMDEGLHLIRGPSGKPENKCRASLDWPNGFYYGPTPLIAALRCRVASKLGAEVDVPDELLALVDRELDGSSHHDEACAGEPAPRPVPRQAAARRRQGPVALAGARAPGDLPRTVRRPHRGHPIPQERKEAFDRRRAAVVVRSAAAHAAADRPPGARPCRNAPVRADECRGLVAIR
ncbi:MAG: hypothetical protein K0Q43_116 [Ramlibacter sp.]|nr:hypothetical protein [Ramlibacter sp.]